MCAFFRITLGSQVSKLKGDYLTDSVFLLDKKLKFRALALVNPLFDLETNNWVAEIILIVIL
jgi:hypothetical protein